MNKISNKQNLIDIKVIGIGGGGNNAVTRMIEDKIKDVEFVLINTELNALKKANPKQVLQIGKESTKGLGAGANAEVGEIAAKESVEEIENIIEGTDMLFLTCGMGGGTGTGATPIIAELARRKDILTIGVVTKPFTFEGKKRILRAQQGIERLKENVDALIVVLNDNLLKIADNKISLQEAFSSADRALKQGIKGITDLITTVGTINIDFADIKTILGYKGLAYMGMGKARGANRLEDATKQAIDNPLTEIGIAGAKGVIFNVKGGENLSLTEINGAVKLINELVDEEANIIFGTVIDEKLKEQVEVTVVATGINKSI